jgi:hypothetical protein
MTHADEPVETVGQGASGLLDEIEEGAFQSSLLALNLFLQASDVGSDTSVVSAAHEAGRLAVQCGGAADEAALLFEAPLDRSCAGTQADGAVSGRLRHVHRRARVTADLVCEIAAAVAPASERRPAKREAREV